MRPMAAGVVTAFPGTPLGTIRESSSSWGSPGSTENPAPLPPHKGAEQAAVVGSCTGETDRPLWQGGPLEEEHRAEGSLLLLHERQTGQEVEGQRAEVACQSDVERQRGHKAEGQRAESAVQADYERQAGQEAEIAGSLQSPFDSVSEVAESLVLEHYGCGSAVSVNSEVMSEADAVTQARVWSAEASGELLSLTVAPSLRTYNAGCWAQSC